MNRVLALIITCLFALSLSGCNHPEHTGFDESNVLVETTSPLKPPMNDELDVGDLAQDDDEDTCTELEEAGEEQDDLDSATVPSDQDAQSQSGSSAPSATGGSANAVSSTGNSGSASSGSSNTGSSSSGSSGSSSSANADSSGGGSSSAMPSGSGGQSSSGGGGSTQGSGQGQSQSQSGSSSSSSSNNSSNNNSSSNNASNAGSSSTSNNSGGSAGNSSNNSSAQTPAPQTITVSIEICARLAHAADPAAVAGISNAGVILSRRNVTVPTGASVRQALDATGVRLNARGAYIAGIGGLSEGDLGSQSGWMFSVNGAFSSQSASAHRLNAGDIIAWRYTIDGGADLGASW